MNHGAPFHVQLGKAVDEKDLLVDAGTFERVRPRIDDIGRERHARLDSILGASWEAAADSETVFSESDFERVLGFGDAMSDFIVAPLELPSSVHSDVVATGNLANLLVSVFDEFIDSGWGPDEVLSSWGLRVAVLGHRPVNEVYSAFCSPLQTAIFRLVVEYFERLGSLPNADSNGFVREKHDEYVAEMYRAERNTVSGRDREGTNRIVSVYPFVVMALSGWLARESFERAAFERHLDWVHDLGEFIGLVDDASDVQEDLDAGDFNMITASKETEIEVQLLERIASKGRGVVDEWQELTSDGEQTAERRMRFETCIASWLGGRPVLR